MRRNRRYWFNNTSGLWRFQGHYQAIKIKKDLGLGFGKEYYVKDNIIYLGLGMGGNYEIRGL